MKELLAEAWRLDNNMAATEETHLQFLVAIAVFVLYGSHSAFDSRLEGSYIARTLNGRSLPAELLVPATAGNFRLFRLEQGVLRLRPSGRFTLYFRYYHQLVRRGDRPTVTPVMSDSETGTYTVSRDKIVLNPEKKSGAKSRAPIAATIAGEEIRATYMLEDGASNQRIALVLRRDASYW
jgi:hypothetical protein